MNRDSQIQLLILASKLLLISLILATSAFSEEPSEKVEKGAYFLHRAPVPERFVTGVSLPELSKARFADMRKVTDGLAGKWGRSLTLFRKEDKKKVRIAVAVYGTVAEAEDSALELLNDTSAVMGPGSKSGDVIGTHSWYLVSPTGSGTVIFVYNNSLFQLFSSDYSMAESSARSIAADLTRGVNGVRLGGKVIRPEVTDIEFPVELREGQETRLILKGQDPYRQRVSFAVSASRGQLLETEKIGEKIYVPWEAGTDELRVYAISEMNVVSQIYTRKIEIEEEK